MEREWCKSVTEFLLLVQKTKTSISVHGNMVDVKSEIELLGKGFDSFCKEASAHTHGRILTAQVTLYLNLVRRYTELADQPFDPGFVVHCCLTSLVTLEFCLQDHLNSCTKKQYL